MTWFAIWFFAGMWAFAGLWFVEARDHSETWQQLTTERSAREAAEAERDALREELDQLRNGTTADSVERFLREVRR